MKISILSLFLTIPHFPMNKHIYEVWSKSIQAHFDFYQKIPEKTLSTMLAFHKTREFWELVGQNKVCVKLDFIQLVTK
jgi:hypothetical protein